MEVEEVQTKLKFWQEAATCIQSLEFEFKTLGQVNAIVGYLEQWFPEGSSAGLGLKELMINAVEHGNLGIGYDKKTHLLREGRWLQEVERRLKLTENKAKIAHLKVIISEKEIKFYLKDEGAGFDARKYMTHATENELHGRGLLMAKNMAFDDLKFKDKGRKIEACLSL